MVSYRGRHRRFRTLLTAALVLPCLSHPCRRSEAQPSKLPAGLTHELAIDVRVAGVKGDGVTNDSPGLSALIAAHPKATFYFPTGTYVLHNPEINRPGLKLEGFSGTIRMAADARFACDNATAHAGQCIWVTDSRGASFENLSITYLDAAALPLPRRVAASNALLVENSRDLRFSNTTVFAATGSGIWNSNDIGIVFDGHTVIRNTSADGIHFENVGQGSISNLATTNTGDDALAVTNIQQDGPNCGFKANRVTIENSRARGIATAGACDASFTGIEIDGTANTAIAVTQDREIHSRRSSNVLVSGATVRRAGRLHREAGTDNCVEVASSTQVVIQQVNCQDSAGDGVMIYGHADNVTVQDVRVISSGNNGFQTAENASNVNFLRDHAQDSGQNGFDIEVSDRVDLEDCTTEDSSSYGFYHSRSSAITEKDLTASNAAKHDPNHRAWWAENLTGFISVDGLAVADAQDICTGFTIGDYANSGAVTLKRIEFRLSHGTYSMQPGPSSHYFRQTHGPR